MIDSNLKCDGLLRIEDCKPFHHGHPAKFLVSRYENCYQAGALKPQSDGQLQGIGTAKCFGLAMIYE